jgi:hypothetical protein
MAAAVSSPPYLPDFRDFKLASIEIQEETKKQIQERPRARLFSISAWKSFREDSFDIPMPAPFCVYNIKLSLIILNREIQAAAKEAFVRFSRAASAFVPRRFISFLVSYLLGLFGGNFTISSRFISKMSQAELYDISGA